MKLQTRTSRYNKARADWEAAIVDAHTEGMSLRQIAAIAGISHGGVDKILRKHEAAS